MGSHKFIFHSRIAEKLIEAGIPFKASKIDKEIKYGESRIDFLLDKKILMEVKGCTFEENGEAMFPDAPHGERAAPSHGVDECSAKWL